MTLPLLSEISQWFRKFEQLSAKFSEFQFSKELKEEEEFTKEAAMMCEWELL
jgi:hypothetical protein